MRSFLVCALLLGATATAHAGVQLCDDLPNPVYMQVGDTQQPLMKELGRALRDNTTPITIVYITSGSCTNIAAIYEDTPTATNWNYIPSTEEDGDWTASDPPLPCAPPDGGKVPDIANSAVFISACDTDPVPMGLEAFTGPIQAYVMAVPEDSDETAITAEEAYFVFGFGDDSMVAPWADETQMFIRTVTKSTLLAWAANIAVPAYKWKGVMNDKSTDVVGALQNTETPEKAIGILGAEIYDRDRDTLDVLAFQAFDQNYAYYPDSSTTSFDKINVRDGHYTVWSPTVYIQKMNERTGEPLYDMAGYVIDMILGLESEGFTPDFDPTGIVIEQGLVPDCAMQVTRNYEGGDLSLYDPPEPCGCYFDTQVESDAADACVACDDENPCADDGVCRHGFCEEH